MTSLSFLTLLAAACFGYLCWGFRVLPQEHWQIMAAMPTRRSGEGPWQGINLTWYGVLSANAYVAAIVLFLLLSGTLSLPLPLLGLFAGGLLALCVPASRLVAQLVEKKAHTLTVGGAVFVGLIASPAVLVIVNLLARASGSQALPVLPVLAALAVAYAFGEGLGRLACLSFGCCYGRPLADSPRWLRRLCGRFAMRFYGATKKIAYASQLEGERVLPVQAMTALLYVAAGLFGGALFLGGHYAWAFVLCVTVTQLWRVASEFLRADFRGTGRLTAYQVMGLLAIPYAVLLVFLITTPPLAAPDLAIGLMRLWSPVVVLLLQGLWLLILFTTGRSAVTGATMNFHVHHERI